MNVLQNNPSIFCFPVTSNAKSNQITKIVCFFFICKISTSDFMVNMQSSWRKFILGFSTSHAFIIVSFFSKFSLSIPVPAIIFYRCTFNIHRMIFAANRQARTFSRTKFYMALVWFLIKRTSASLTNKFDNLFHALMLTFFRAILTSLFSKSIWLRIKEFSTYLTSSFYLCSSFFDLAFFTTNFSGSKFQEDIFNIKFFSTILTFSSNYIHKKSPFVWVHRCLGDTENKWRKLDCITTPITVSPRQYGL